MAPPQRTVLLVQQPKPDRIAVPNADARSDLAHALDVALARYARLFTSGELCALAAWSGASPNAQALYARLLGRRPRVFWLDELSYSEVDDTAAAGRELCSRNLAWPTPGPVPDRLLLEASTVPRLKQLARAHGLPVGGRRSALVQRLRSQAAPIAPRRPGLLLRNRPLFRRVARLFLHDHRGDLSRVVVERMGVVRYVPYAPTRGPGLWPHRRALLRYERGLARRWALELADLVAQLPQTLERLSATPSVGPERWRFSGRRFDLAMALAAARELERVGDHGGALAAYRRCMDAEPQRSAAVAVGRMALCLERTGQAAQGAALCAEWGGRVSAQERQGLGRTGRRLARKARVGWRPFHPLRSPTVRRLRLDPAPQEGPRPLWATPDGLGVPVEAAVQAQLAALGRQSVHGEGLPWRTLFGMLFWDVLFAEVPGALPAPMLTAPLDLGTPLFFERRRAVLEARLSALESGAAPELLAEAWDQHHGAAIAGVSWGALPLADWLALCSALEGPALSGLMRPFAQDWRHAHRGLPDLIVLPGSAVRLPQAFPARVPAGLLLCEIKGPTDALQDAQRVWLDRLMGQGVATEVWEVGPAVP